SSIEARVVLVLGTKLVEESEHAVAGKFEKSARRVGSSNFGGAIQVAVGAKDQFAWATAVIAIDEGTEVVQRGQVSTGRECEDGSPFMSATRGSRAIYFAARSLDESRWCIPIRAELLCTKPI